MWANGTYLLASGTGEPISPMGYWLNKISAHTGIYGYYI